MVNWSCEKHSLNNISFSKPKLCEIPVNTSSLLQKQLDNMAARRKRDRARVLT